MTMELLNGVSVTRDNLRGTLELALKDRSEMLTKLVTLRGQLETSRLARLRSLDRGSTSLIRA
jgi:hypothetical protein